MTCVLLFVVCFFFFQAEDGIRDLIVTGVQTCALPISIPTSVVTCAGAAGMSSQGGLVASSTGAPRSGAAPRRSPMYTCPCQVSEATQLQIGRASCRERV